MNFFEVIFLIFALTALVTAIFFFIKQKGDRIANIFLGIYLILFAYNITFNCFYWSRLLHTQDYIHLFFTNNIPWISYGPLFYLYIKRIIVSKKIIIQDALHFTPLLLLIIFRWPLLKLDAVDKFTVVSNNTWSNYGYSPKFTSWLIVFQLLIYGVLSIHIFKKYMNRLDNNKRLWFRVFIGSFFGYWIAFTSYFVLQHFNLITTQNDYAIGYVMVFFISTVIYFAIKQPDVFNGLPMQKVLLFIKYQKTGLPKTRSLELKERLSLLMQSDKPYLENDLKLNDLANALRIPRHHMSQVINEHFQLSFFDYINQYRINDAKSLLIQKKSDMNITQVAYSVGFNNKVSFYKAFKKFESLTPTEYISLNS